MDDTNALSADEAKYFETGGTTDLPEPEPVETPVEKAPEPEPQPEVKKETPPEIEVVEDDDGEGEPDQRKYVKVGVLRKEREQRKILRNEVEQTRQQVADLRRQIEEAKNPPREITAEELPHVALERVHNLEQQLAQQAAKHNFVTTWQQKATEYAKEQADFPQAYQHALATRRTMYELGGFNQQQVNAMLESEEAAIVERALIAGENPAATFYKIAQTLGYKPAAKEEAKKDDATNAVVKNAEKLAAIAKGMEKNKSVSGGGGADAAPSLTELADMDDAEFEKATAGKNWEKMMGG